MCCRRAPSLLALLLLLLLAGCGDDAAPVAPSPVPEAGQTAAEAQAEAGTGDAGGSGAAAGSEGGSVRVEPVPDEEGSPPVPPDPGPLPEAEVALVGPEGERLELTAEIAADADARQRGLMLRPEVREGAGMLFLFPEDSEGGFWMRNTLVPLDIAYVDADGRVVDVRTMTPCEEDPCRSYRPAGPYRYALEVEAGVLTDRGVDGEWELELPEDLPDAS